MRNKHESFKTNVALGLALAAGGILSITPCRAAGGKEMANPDLTQGESIPAGATHDWNLGATGANAS